MSSGPSRPDHGIQQPIELAFLCDRSTFEHVFQSTARLAAGDEVDGHRRKEFAHRERAADRGALTDARRSIGDGIPHWEIRYDLARDAQRFEDRHRGGRENAEGAREACGIEAAGKLTDERHP